EEQLAGKPARTQFGRALRELGVEWITAHSPQAKAYASYCTSCKPCAALLSKRRRFASLTPGALRGGSGPGSSYNHASLSLAGWALSRRWLRQLLTRRGVKFSRSAVSSIGRN